MSATKSKPAGRAVGIRKAWISDNDFIRSRMPLHENDQQCIIVTGYTGSARQLKRLVEIAGMDDLPKHLAQKLWETSSLRHGLFMPTQFQGICEHVIREALGLSTAQGRRNNHTKTNKPRNT